MERDSWRNAKLPLLFVLLIVCAAIGTCIANVADADDSPEVRRAEARALLAAGAPGQDLDPAVVLARVCVKEAGFDSPDDCAGIRVVLERVGRGDVVAGARLYTPRTFLPARLGARAWIAFLRGDGERPQGWPQGMEWERYRARWLGLVEHSRRVLGGPLWCDAEHWGDALGDRARAIRNGWIPVACGDSRNLFWRRP
jgi:hypothetical protein